MNRNIFRLLLISGLAPILFSCVNSRKVVLFNELNQESIQSKVENLEPVIQKNDLLNITVSSLSADASVLFNKQTVTTTASGNFTNSTATVVGYLVDQDGYIEFPVLGKLKAAGLSKKQLKDNITKGLTDGKLLINPSVDIRYLNYKVTVIGEVAKPVVISVPNEKITLLEAIGLAGDLTLFARRDNVLIIRETDGQKSFKRIDLNSNEIFTSPYYYLKSNDIVYVEPTKQKLEQVSSSRYWVPAIISSTLSLILILDRIFRNN